MNLAERAAEYVVSIARNEIGYLEKASNANLDSDTANAGKNNYTKYARDLDNLGVYNGRKNGYYWCTIFVFWCLQTAFGLDKAFEITNQIKGGSGASCTHCVSRYKAMGRFYKTPKVGDQIFFSKTNGKDFFHTGIVSRVTADRVYTIEGNTSIASGVVDNGGGVAEKSYALSYKLIGGYGRPDYSKITEQDLKQEDEDMTVERFKELWAEMRKELQDNDAANWSKNARDWAVSSGLIAGDGSADFNGMWQDLLTREQMVTILYRFAQIMGKA